MDTLLSDLRLAFRQIGRRPGISLVAILALAIGLGINTVAFSTVNAFLFRPRAGFDVEGAGRIQVSGVATGEEGLSIEEFDRLTAGTSGALDTAVEGRTSLAWTHDGTSETVWALMVSRAYFPVLETRPLVGRLLDGTDIPSAPAAVVSERFWREQLKAASLDTLRLAFNGVDVPVAGVLPDSFEGPGGLYAPQVWLPYEARQTLRLPSRFERTGERWLGMIGRVRPGASIAEVNARLETAGAALAHEQPDRYRRWRARFTLLAERVDEVRTLAWFAAAGMAAVSLVLLIACFNVANLLMARAVERQREVAIRAAVGASRWRLVRQHVTEGVVLASLAGIAAVVVAMWSQRLVSGFAVPIAEPQRLNVQPDWRVIGFAALASLVAGVLPALGPALHAVRLDLVRALSSQGAFGSGGRVTAARHALMFVQIAGSVAFLTIAAMLVQSFAWAGSADPGFETTRAIVMRVDLASQGYDAVRAKATIDRVIERLQGTPGIDRAAAATTLPFYIGYPRLTDVALGQQACASGGCPRVDTYGIAPGYFQAMRVPMVRGREFDAVSPPDAVVINETFADRWFASGDPVGQVIRTGAGGELRTVVGVARNTAQRSLFERPAPALYLPLGSGDYETGVSIVASTIGPAGPLVRAAESAVRDVDSRLAAESIMTMRDRLELPRWPMKVGSLFFTACGAMALLLATIGLIAVVSHAVTQRTREFGVRIAVGATRWQLMRDVTLSTLRVVGPGVAAGLVAAGLLARSLRIVLVGIDASRAWVYVGIAVLHVAIAILACAAPARRASRVDPLIALRSE